MSKIDIPRNCPSLAMGRHLLCLLKVCVVHGRAAKAEQRLRE
jgi:hypothetical protein